MSILLKATQGPQTSLRRASQQRCPPNIRFKEFQPSRVPSVLAASGKDSSSSSTGSSKLTTDWEARRKQRVINDLVDASKRLGPQYTRDAIAEGVETLEALLPGLQIDVEAMKASDWARLCLDVSAAATRLVVLKSHYPRADLPKIIQRQPLLLLQDIAVLEDNAKQVKQLLESAKDPDALLTALPSLMEPRTLISVLVTVKKWYFNKRDPVEVLESDPELIIRAQACGVPFEPVYVDKATGAWSAPGYNYLEKRADWQKYLDEKHKKKDYLEGDKMVPKPAALMDRDVSGAADTAAVPDGASSAAAQVAGGSSSGTTTQPLQQ